MNTTCMKTPTAHIQLLISHLADINYRSLVPKTHDTSSWGRVFMISLRSALLVTEITLFLEVLWLVVPHYLIGLPVVNTNTLLSKLEIPRHWWEGIYADLPNLRVGCPPQTNHSSRLHFSQIRFTVCHKSNSSIEPARNPGETVVFQAHIGSGGGYSLGPSRSVLWPLSEPSSWALTLTAPNASPQDSSTTLFTGCSSNLENSHIWQHPL